MFMNYKFGEIVVFSMCNTCMYLARSILGSYRIALIFRGSKFSRIAVFKNFVEIISQIRSSNMPHPHFSGARQRATKD